MAKVRIFVTDSRNGSSTLVSTVDTSAHTVVHHVSREVWTANCKNATQRVKNAFEDIAKQNPSAVIRLCEEESRMIG